MNSAPARRKSLLSAGGLIVLGLILVIVTGAGALFSTPHNNAPLVGAWSGGGMTLQLTSQGGHYYQIDCTEGGLVGPALVDATGVFTATAWVTHINPVPSLATPTPAPPGSGSATLTGRVSRDRMDLQIQLNSAGASPSRYNLTPMTVFTEPTSCP